MAQDNFKLAQKLFNYTNTHSIPGMMAGNQSKIESMTFNPRYPGFDEQNYRKLESKIDELGLVGNEREKAMDQLYVQVLPQVQNQIINSDRRKYINDAAYEVSQIQNKSDKTQAKSKLTVTELAQQLKEKFNIDPTANDEEVFNSWIESIPNGGQLLADYMNDGDPQLLYQGGLESVPEDARQKLKDNFWDNLWDNIKTKANVPVDNIKKWGQRTLNNLGAEIYKNILKKTVGDVLPEKMGINLDNYVNTFQENAITPRVQENVTDYQNKINQAYAAKEQKNLDQDIKNYYDQKGYTEMLKEGDFRGFLFKSMGDAAQNWEMPVVVAASVFQPEVGMALMTTDAYARENQEAFENMMNNGASYEEAEQGAVVVGLVNAAVEVTLEKLIGGVETSASGAIRKTLMKNVQEEAAKKGLGRILLEGAGTQLRASGEEGLEEIVQQIVQNAAVKTVNENQKLFEGVGAAFEGGFYNPMNLLAGGGNLTQNVNQNKDVVRQQIMDGAYNAGQAARTVTDMFRGTPGKSKNVWQKVVETSTRSIPEKVVENELKLTPTERKNVERYGITPANFVLEENIAGLSNADKVIALQDISSDAYNNVTDIFKNVIPQDYRTESKTAGKMLQTMIDTMEKSDIVKEEYADYIAKLKEMLDYSDFSPYEKLAIRRDFDAIVGNDIFGANGRVKGLEDQTIAKWRADLNEEINQLGDEFGVDVKSENARIANAITIRDGLLRALSQNKKNNAIGLQDLGIGAILSAGNPVQAGGIIIAKRLLENAAGNIAQGLYNKNNTPLTPSNTKRGAGFIQRPGTNANNNFMISTTSSDNSINSQEELNTEDIDVGTNPLDTIPDRNVGVNPTDLTATEEVIEEEVITTPKKKSTKKKTSKKGLDKNQASSKTAEDIDNETPQDIDYQDLAELENETLQDLDYQELAELENETPQIDPEERQEVEEKAEVAEIEILPSDVSVKKEAAKVGEKRIAPDRILRQQLTFDEGVNKVYDNIKTIADYLTVRAELYTSAGYNDGELNRRHNELQQEASKALYGKDRLGFVSDRSAEFKDLWKNIRDNKENPTALKEIAKTFYISKVKKDISKGYQFPIAVLEKIPGVQKALNARERYQKGLDTSFSSKDARIDYSEQDKIGGGIKSQDGKQVTKEQKDNIVKGILDFQDVFGINVKKLAEDKGIVFVDLHGGNAFLSQAAGMYRESWEEEGGPRNVSVSVGGSETIRWKDKQTKEWKTEKVNTTMSHELGHAMDYLVDKKLLDRSDYLDLYQKYKKPERRTGGFADYLKRPTEVTARAFEEYMNVAKGGDTYYDKVGYWNKDDFEYIVKPILEEAIEKKLGDWRLKK